MRDGRGQNVISAHPWKLGCNEHKRLAPNAHSDVFLKELVFHIILM